MSLGGDGTRGDAATAPKHADRELVNLPCEVCGNELSQPFLSLRYPQYGYRGRFELRRCAGCGLVFNSPRLAPAALAQLYDRNYYIFTEPEGAAFERVVQLHRATVSRLEAMAPAAAPMLEVGSAKGYMQALLQDRGHPVQGVELSAHASAFARERLGQASMEGSLEAWLHDAAFKPLPLAYSTDVIEHVPSPRAFVRALRTALLPGGLVLIGTPNIASEGVAAHGKEWLGFNPFHIWLFSRETLSRLLASEGFVVEQAWSFGNLEFGHYPRQSPLRRGLRDFAARSGVLPLARRLRRTPEPADVDTLARLRAEAGMRLRTSARWEDGADGRHPRAQACLGDNLVLLARRVG